MKKSSILRIIIAVAKAISELKKSHEDSTSNAQAAITSIRIELGKHEVQLEYFKGAKR